MKFTVLSHAGLFVESKSTSLLFDPWLLGSAYWRSWWNFPEPPQDLIRSIQPTAIYLTHLHWDHFHGPSLKLFSKDTKFYVPKFLGDRMVHDLKSLKFRNVQELDHGETVDVGEGLKLTSFQFGPVCPDSAAVVTDGDTTLCNFNDAKFFGPSLKQVTSRFPKVDFCFRSHSEVPRQLPYCVKGYEETFPDFRTQDDYAAEFTHFALGVGARYAIPFASNHCYLHKDTERFNATSVDPVMVRETYKENRSRGFYPNQIVSL